MWLCDFNAKHAQNILPVNCIRSSDYRKAKSCGRLAQNAAKAYIWIKTKRIILKNVRTESRMPLRLCDNMEMFKDVEVIQLAN